MTRCSTGDRSLRTQLSLTSNGEYKNLANRHRVESTVRTYRSREGCHISADYQSLYSTDHRLVFLSHFLTTASTSSHTFSPPPRLPLTLSHHYLVFHKHLLTTSSYSSHFRNTSSSSSYAFSPPPRLPLTVSQHHLVFFSHFLTTTSSSSHNFSPPPRLPHTPSRQHRDLEDSPSPPSAASPGRHLLVSAHSAGRVRLAAGRPRRRAASGRRLTPTRARCERASRCQLHGGYACSV